MNRIQKIIINLSILCLFGVFIGYVLFSFRSEDQDFRQTASTEIEFNSPLDFLSELVIHENIKHLAADNDRFYLAGDAAIYAYDQQGQLLKSIPVEKDLRDMIVLHDTLYLLYPQSISIQTINGSPVNAWEACSDLSDYRSFTLTNQGLYVTDSANKNICHYTKTGNFVRFINSPRGFIVPGLFFAITQFNDTIYCVNPGRHLIESYSPNGKFIAAFGGPGGDLGSFSGCCNPAYISFDESGDLYTSEKGNPRICLYDRDGNFKEQLLNNRLLGGGNRASAILNNPDGLVIADKNKLRIYQRKNNQL